MKNLQKLLGAVILSAAALSACAPDAGDPDRVRYLTKAAPAPTTELPRQPDASREKGAQETRDQETIAQETMREQILSRRESAALLPTRNPETTRRPPVTPTPLPTVPLPSLRPETPWEIPWLYHPATRDNNLAGLGAGARDTLRAAEQQEEAGNGPEALRLYRLALETQPDHPTLLGRTGDAELAYGDHARAVPIYQRAQSGPEDSTNRIKWATVLMLDGQCTEATRVLEQTSPGAWTNSAQHSQPAEANWIFAQCLAQEGELEQALLFVDAARKAAEGQEYPETFQYHLQELEVLLHLTRDNTAMHDLAAHGLAHRAREIERAVQDGDCQDAVPRLKELIREMEGLNLPMAHFHTGVCLAHNEQHQEALEYLRNTLQTMPRHPAAHIQTAMSLLGTDERQAARDQARMALDVRDFSWKQDESTHVTAHIITARSHARESNLGLALSAAQKALDTARERGLDQRTEEIEQYAAGIQASMRELDIP